MTENQQVVPDIAADVVVQVGGGHPFQLLIVVWNVPEVRSGGRSLPERPGTFQRDQPGLVVLLTGPSGLRVHGGTAPG